MSSDLGTFTVGQVPSSALVITVNTPDGPTDLTVYDSVELMIFDPNDVLLDASSAFTLDPVTTPVNQVTCHWPDYSILTVAGEYTYQLMLIGPGNVVDMSGPGSFVVEPLGVIPTGQSVLAYLGNEAETDPQMLDLVSARLPVVTVFAKAYTRGVGFENGVPNDELAAVITSAAAREVSVDSLGATREQIGEHYSVYYAVDPCNWSLRELTILNMYRVRAA